MAIEVEREPNGLPVQDDPMRTFGAPRNGTGPVAQIGDPAPLGLAALGLTLMVPPAERGSALGLYFIAWAIFTALLWVASTRTTAVVSVMLLALTVSFLLLGIGEAGPHSEIVKVGGWFGLGATAAALYGAFAGAINGTYARTLLPLVPLQRRRATG